MSSKILTPATLGALVVSGLALAQPSFAFNPLSQGYLLSAQQAAAPAKGQEGSCGADKAKGHEGSCGADKAKGHEGSCGADKAKTEGKCGEGKCGAGKMGAEGNCGGMMGADTNKDGKISAAEHNAFAKSRFDAMDKNHDGMVDAGEMKAMHEGKCGEGKCGGKK